ncbi:hypothetical protein BB561_000503 [Smittium simulii]|uniref:Protein Zds1 C-terminal domain-containing protein n=1 Tax=Smittium simulii TaxID=133385 RepID=A0A2T9YYT3_9FUNG|nr:hypothetical protein BB561_000503 [Smittium simulii]
MSEHFDSEWLSTKLNNISSQTPDSVSSHFVQISNSEPTFPPPETIVWLPARFHPEISPKEYETWISKYGTHLKRLESSPRRRKSILGLSKPVIEELPESNLRKTTSLSLNRYCSKKPEAAFIHFMLNKRHEPTLKRSKLLNKRLTTRVLRTTSLKPPDSSQTDLEIPISDSRSSSLALDPASLDSASSPPLSKSATIYSRSLSQLDTIPSELELNPLSFFSDLPDPTPPSLDKSTILSLDIDPSNSSASLPAKINTPADLLELNLNWDFDATSISTPSSNSDHLSSLPIKSIPIPQPKSTLHKTSNLYTNLSQLDPNIPSIRSNALQRKSSAKNSDSSNPSDKKISSSNDLKKKSSIFDNIRSFLTPDRPTPAPNSYSYNNISNHKPNSNSITPKPFDTSNNPSIRYPIHVERAIYQLAGLKLSHPRRPLRQQVLLSNMMYWYLELINPFKKTISPPAGQSPSSNSSSYSYTDYNYNSNPQSSSTPLIYSQNAQPNSLLNSHSNENSENPTNVLPFLNGNPNSNYNSFDREYSSSQSNSNVIDEFYNDDHFSEKCEYYLDHENHNKDDEASNQPNNFISTPDQKATTGLNPSNGYLGEFNFDFDSNLNSPKSKNHQNNRPTSTASDPIHYQKNTLLVSDNYSPFNEYEYSENSASSDTEKRRSDDDDLPLAMHQPNQNISKLVI